MRKAENALLNELLSYERERRLWTQEEVAERIGAPDPNMVGRWERGITHPTSHYRQQLARLFGKSARELGFVRKREIPFWHVPYRQNVFFTGREELLQQIHAHFSLQKQTAVIPPLALSGLGGVGKTQTALEYTYRYGHEYHTVAWMRADSPEALFSDFAALAGLLKLPEYDLSNQQYLVNAVRHWLSALTRWLLIFDNADDLEPLSDFLPSLSRGHILLTTRMQMTGTLAEPLIIEAMAPREGAYFLLRRAKIVALGTGVDDIDEADCHQAMTVAETLGGLPLALDQAGAYVEETGCGLSDYLQVYQAHRAELLHWRGELALYHPEPVITTWSLSLEKLRQNSPSTVELLHCFAFLNPDAIPEELLTKGAIELGPQLAALAAAPLQLHRALKELRKFSLVRRHPETNMLTIHRLVQVVLLERMDEEIQRLWVWRVVRALNRVFPKVDSDSDLDSNTREQCERFLPQAQVCIELIERWHLCFLEAAALLHRVGNYALQRIRHDQAEHLFKLSLAMREEIGGSQDPLVAESLTDLGIHYFLQSKFVQAEPLLQRAFAIREQALGLEHAQTAESLNNLALIYSSQQKYVEAEPLYQQAVLLQEKILGMEHPAVSETLSNLAVLYYKQGKLGQAEVLYQRALAIRENSQGPDHTFVGVILLNLAAVYREQKQYAQAEALYLRALALWERTLEPDDPDIAYVLSGLAKLSVAQSEYARAEPLYQRAQAIFEKAFGPQDPRAIERLKDLAGIARAKGEYTQAEQYCRKVITIVKKAFGSEDPRVAEALDELAKLSGDN